MRGALHRVVNSMVGCTAVTQVLYFASPSYATHASRLSCVQGSMWNITVWAKTVYMYIEAYNLAAIQIKVLHLRVCSVPLTATGGYTWKGYITQYGSTACTLGRGEPGDEATVIINCNPHWLHTVVYNYNGKFISSVCSTSLISLFSWQADGQSMGPLKKKSKLSSSSHPKRRWGQQSYILHNVLTMFPIHRINTRNHTLLLLCDL